MDIDARQAFSSMLQRDETLIWAGTPKRGLQLRAADAFLVPFSLAWGIPVILAGGRAIVKSNAAPAYVFGAVFVAAGLYAFIGRFFWDALRRANTVYAVTNRRVIIWSGVVSKTAESIFLDTLEYITITPESGGFGTILLGRAVPLYDWFAGTGWPRRNRYEAPDSTLSPIPGRSTIS